MRSILLTMDVNMLRAELRKKGWTISSLAERWGFSRRHVSSMINAPQRSQLWNDACAGIGQGPGLYRQCFVTQTSFGSSPTDASINGPLILGSLVASEAEMHTFGFGSRGVVVDFVQDGSFLVVWDGGSIMEIDSRCLSEWVVDLGLRLAGSESWPALPSSDRIAIAMQAQLYG